MPSCAFKYHLFTAYHQLYTPIGYCNLNAHYLHAQPSRCFFLHRILLCECVCWAAVRSYITRLWTIRLHLKGLLTHCRRHSHIILIDVRLMVCAEFFSHSDPDQRVCLLRIKNKSPHDFIQSTELYNQRKWVNKEK